MTVGGDGAPRVQQAGIEVKIFDKDMIGKDLLGTATIPFDDLWESAGRPLVKTLPVLREGGIQHGSYVDRLSVWLRLPTPSPSPTLSPTLRQAIVFLAACGTGYRSPS